MCRFKVNSLVIQYNSRDKPIIVLKLWLHNIINVGRNLPFTEEKFSPGNNNMLDIHYGQGEITVHSSLFHIVML